VDTVYGLIALAAVLGAIGLALGLLVGLGVVRWAGGSHSAARRAAIVLIAVILAIGVWQVTSIRTEPTSNADAKAHDYSLAGLDVALAAWATLINTGGAALGVYIAIRWQSRRPHPGDPIEPLQL